MYLLYASGASRRSKFSYPDLKKTHYSKLTIGIFFIVSILYHVGIQAQTVTISIAGSGTFNVPCDVTSITVEVWGGGGAGGGTTLDNAGGGAGGAGGAYASSSLNVTPGQSINYNVGAGATGNTTSGASGGATWFGTTATLFAQGGAGGAAPNGATATGGIGSSTLSIGNTVAAGTNGANGTPNVGGAGGNGANGGGNGGNQRTTGGNGNNGLAPGGGGAGAFVNNTTNRTGGNGGDGQIRISYTSSQMNYCIPTFTSAIEPITNVIFAGINRTTSNTVNGSTALEAFCDTAIVQQNTTYPISIKGNTDGNFTNYIRVYIDWDRNGTFGNVANEVYDIGTITNSTGVDAVVLNGNIAVPSTALIGMTAMRVMKRFAGYSTNPCQTGSGYGQAEDYVVNVSAPQPPTISSFPTPVCPGSTITIVGTNLLGTTSVTIGGTAATITANNATSVTVTLGAGTTGPVSVTTSGGTAVSSTNMVFNTSPSMPGGLSSTPAPYCSPVIISAAGTPPAGVTWYWQTVSNGTSTANSNPTYTLNSEGAYTIYLRAQNNATGCWSNERSITRTVIEPVTTIATNPVPADATIGVCYAGNGAVSSLNWNAVTNATSYDVYFGTSATPSFVANRTVTNYTTGTLLANTTYYWSIVPKNNCGNTSGTPMVWSFTTASAPCYCTPSVSNFYQTSTYINTVSFIGTLNDVTNNSTYSNNPRGYQDFTGLTNISRQAQGEGINVFANIANYVSYMKAWVDWNQDGNFAAGELVYSSGTTGIFSTTFGFQVPLTQTPGLYRIRIRINETGGSSTFDACQNIAYYGETEDYVFEVIPSCAAIITSLADGENCGDPSGGNVVVNLSATGSAGTTEIRWYNALTGGSIVQTTAVSSGTTAYWSPSLSATSTYYVTAFNGSCESLVRTAIVATVKPVANITYTPTNPESCGEDSIVTLTATGDNEIVTLIDERFEDAGLSGLGTFTGQTLGTNNAQANWRRRQSTFIPAQQVWFPAISSGFGPNKFAMATSDVGAGSYDNALRSPVVSTVGFLNLTLSFRMYYSDYYASVAGDNVSIEVSTNGGTNWTNAVTYNSTIGIGTRFSEITLNVPSTYLNQPNLRIRFRYSSGWGDGVAIDDIKLYGERPLAPLIDYSTLQLLITVHKTYIPKLVKMQ